MDKKILVPKNEYFLVRMSGLEPPTPCMSSPPDGENDTEYHEITCNYDYFFIFFVKLLTLFTSSFL